MEKSFQKHRFKVSHCIRQHYIMHHNDSQLLAQPRCTSACAVTDLLLSCFCYWLLLQLLSVSIACELLLLSLLLEAFACCCLETTQPTLQTPTTSRVRPSEASE